MTLQDLLELVYAKAYDPGNIDILVTSQDGYGCIPAREHIKFSVHPDAANLGWLVIYTPYVRELK